MSGSLLQIPDRYCVRSSRE